MENKKVFRRTIGMALATGALASLLQRAGSAADAPWRIGGIFPLTGNLAVLGNEAATAAEIAVDMVNEKGGVLGRKVDFIRADGVDPQKSASEAKRLITQEKVDLLTGTYGSANAMAIGAVADRQGVMYWELAAVAEDLTKQGYKYVFRTNENTRVMANSMIDVIPDVLAAKLGKTPGDLKIAVLHEDSVFGTSIAKALQDRAGEKGLKIAQVIPYSAASVDLAPMVLKMKQFDPDVLLVVQYVNDSVLFWRQAKENGYAPKAVVAAGTGQSSPDFVKGVGSDAADGVFVSDAFWMSTTGLTPEAAALQREFIKRYTAKMGKTPTYALKFSTSMYILLTHIVPKAGSFDPAAIKKVAMSLDEPYGTWPLGYGIKYDDGGQNTRSLMIIFQYQNGAKPVVVWPKSMADGQVYRVPLPAWNQR
jgi:branched-chain amino acid transport system substrate-binding protein